MAVRPAPKPGRPAKRRIKRAPSIMQEKKECYFSGTTKNLHAHEVFYGSAYRKLSLQYGCWVYLRGDLHNQSNRGVHYNRELDLRLKKETQAQFEKLYGHEKYMEIFDINYL